MKKIILFLTSAFLVNFVNSQNFQGIANYESKTKLKGFSFSSPDMTESQQKQMSEELSKAFEKSYVLTFNAHESIFHEEEKLDQPKPQNGSFQVSFQGGSEKLYKNIMKKIFSEEKELFSKSFLIKDSLEVYSWKLINEEKKIGNYTCYKAILVFPVTEKEKQEFEEMKKKQENSKTTFFIVDEPKERIVEAWYSIEIPISNGPKEFWGLPGLILELHDGDTSFLCSKIVLNTEKKIEIKQPKNGKIVTQKKFEELQEERLKSMMNEDGVIEIKMN